jgi:cytochrome c peroxidase
LGSLLLSPSQSADERLEPEPITPIPELPKLDPLKVRLGERLFGDPRLSDDNSRSCLSCHDLATNGARTRSHESPIRIHGTDRLPAVVSSRLGEDTDEILSSVLNLSEPEIDALRAEGVIGSVS